MTNRRQIYDRQTEKSQTYRGQQTENSQTYRQIDSQTEDTGTSEE